MVRLGRPASIDPENPLYGGRCGGRLAKLSAVDHSGDLNVKYENWIERLEESVEGAAVGRDA